MSRYYCTLAVKFYSQYDPGFVHIFIFKYRMVYRTNMNALSYRSMEPNYRTILHNNYTIILFNFVYPVCCSGLDWKQVMHCQIYKNGDDGHA